MIRSVFVRKLFVAIAILASLCSPWPAGVRADDTRSDKCAADWVQIVSATGRGLRTYVARPQEPEATRAVVILHENRGLTAWELEMASRLATAGFVVVAPDLLSERGPNRGNSDAFESAAAARDAIHALSPDEILTDLDAVVEYADHLPARIDDVVVVGFCWGGAQAFRYAAHNPQLAAVINFYGAAPNEDAIVQIRVPVYAFYGEKDVRISADVPKLKSRLRALAKDYDPLTYAGAGHGFMRTGAAQDAGPADRKAHDEAWQRFAELLGTL